MKWDFDLLRLILLDIQNMPVGTICSAFTFTEQYDPVTVSEHVRLLIAEGLINGKMITVRGAIDKFTITGLTWKGQDFVDVAKDNSIWAKVKRKLLISTTRITYDLVLEWLKIEAKGKKPK